MLCQITLSDRASKLLIRQRKRRAWFLGGIRVLIGLTWLCSIALAVMFGLVDAHPTHDLIEYAQVISGVWAFMAAGTDIIIMAVLCMVLQKELRGFNAKTDETIWR
ncbi:hypothetical protein RQP46_002992 [Phenoliferia psychrophenolica]